MFVYQDKDGNICVTFNNNKPVKNPEYVIAIDEPSKVLRMVSGIMSPVQEGTGGTAPPEGLYTQEQLDAAIERAIQEAFASIKNAEECEY